jgi:hypothetical protein
MAEHRRALPDGEWLDVNGIRTRYYDHGSGETVVFIYGGNFGMGIRIALHMELEFRSVVEKLSRRAFDKLYRSPTTREPTTTRCAVVRHIPSSSGPQSSAGISGYRVAVMPPFAFFKPDM